jgi:hypothetical protein
MFVRKLLLGTIFAAALPVANANAIITITF